MTKWFVRTHKDVTFLEIRGMASADIAKIVQLVENQIGDPPKSITCSCVTGVRKTLPVAKQTPEQALDVLMRAIAHAMLEKKE